MKSVIKMSGPMPYTVPGLKSFTFTLSLMCFESTKFLDLNSHKILT